MLYAPAAPDFAGPSPGQGLFQPLLQGGAAAAGSRKVGLVPGAPADVLVMDTTVDALAGVPSENLLDALVFATDVPAFAQTWVGGVTDR